MTIVLRDNGPEPGGHLRALWRVPAYPRLFACSVLWNTANGAALFTVSYLLTQLDGRPMVNQVAGALLFAPNLVGGLVAGAVSDRFGRRRMILTVQSMLIPATFLMFWLVRSGEIRVWMAFPFMFLQGVGSLTNFTAQRPLIFERVGLPLVAPAMVVEAVLQSAGQMVGGLAGGALIGRAGIDAGFAAMGTALCLSLLLMWRVPKVAAPTGQRRATAEVPGMSVGAQLRAGRALVRRSPRMRAMLLGTIVANLFMFGYGPLIPVVSGHFAAGAETAGLLVAAPGIGQIISGLVMTYRKPGHHYAIFFIGTAGGLLGLLLFANSPFLALAFLALFVSGIFQSGFVTMQSLLAIEAVGNAERGVALGVMSTCIGALPLGTLLMGILAEAFGTRPALSVSSLTGLILLGVLMLVFRGRVAEPAPESAMGPR
jgi:MFS family permease